MTIKTYNNLLLSFFIGFNLNSFYDFCVNNLTRPLQPWKQHTNSCYSILVAAVPSSTPVTIEAKLSSSRIMSAACLLTSDPAIPIATPVQTQLFTFRQGKIRSAKVKNRLDKVIGRVLVINVIYGTCNVM